MSSFCALFQSHRWIQTGVAVWKCSNLAIFLSRVTLKFERWPWKTTGHLFYATSSFFTSFQSHWWIQTGVTVRKRWIRFKIDTFLSCVTLKFDRWPWKTIGHLFYATSSFVHHFIVICKFKQELRSGNIQFGSQSMIFLAVWPWNLTDDLEKQIRNLFYATSSFLHNFVTICEFKLELQSGNAHFGSKSVILCLVWPWNLTDDLEKQ